MYNCIYIYIYIHTSNAEFSTVKYSIVLHEKISYEEIYNQLSPNTN